ncbi:C39 family peptidase [Micromonospora sp. KC721]|uniref:C39 family peptidase n=1 Tax=Micromonospora sp. KC721 TaxID=2530380 RepID=UPI0010504EBC|nr:C39 family peptidase [Micromonospora sp. KC721]TDB77243.1 phytochelatin synthase [Micromonospora sp. KC721]
MNSNVRNSMLSVAGLIMAGGGIAGPALAAQATPAEKAAAALVSEKGRGAHRVGHEYQAQPNFYYCGPASTRIALSAAGKAVSQDELAEKLGTTEAGTDSALDITRVLNEYTGGTYKTTEISADVASDEQVERLRADVLAAVDADRPVVANIRGSALDVDGVTHSYAGHYLTVVEYKDDGETVRIADPGAPDAPEYWMGIAELANWIAGRGYSS